jgi:hypothetical protein
VQITKIKSSGRIKDAAPNNRQVRRQQTERKSKPGFKEKLNNETKFCFFTLQRNTEHCEDQIGQAQRKNTVTALNMN